MAPLIPQSFLSMRDSMICELQANFQQGYRASVPKGSKTSKSRWHPQIHILGEDLDSPSVSAEAREPQLYRVLGDTLSGALFRMFVCPSSYNKRGRRLALCEMSVNLIHRLILCDSAGSSTGSAETAFRLGIFNAFVGSRALRVCFPMWQLLVHAASAHV